MTKRRKNKGKGLAGDSKFIPATRKNPAKGTVGVKAGPPGDMGLEPGAIEGSVTKAGREPPGGGTLGNYDYATLSVSGENSTVISNPYLAEMMWPSGGTGELPSGQNVQPSGQPWGAEDLFLTYPDADQVKKEVVSYDSKADVFHLVSREGEKKVYDLKEFLYTPHEYYRRKSVLLEVLLEKQKKLTAAVAAEKKISEIHVKLKTHKDDKEKKEEHKTGRELLGAGKGNSPGSPFESAGKAETGKSGKSGKSGESGYLW